MFGAIVAMVAFTSSARADEDNAAIYFRNDAAMRVAALVRPWTQSGIIPRQPKPLSPTPRAARRA